MEKENEDIKSLGEKCEYYNPKRNLFPKHTKMNNQKKKKNNPTRTKDLVSTYYVK